MKLLFQVKPTSGVPIYRQIIDQVNRLVVSGYLKPGDELPSVRQVAGYLEVNQMTISKAYSLLEATGVLERNRGKRMQVAAGRGKTQTLKKRLQLIRPVLMEAVTQSRQLALPKEEILKELERLMEDEQ
ncbi:MAG: GntR family transcriptional regulator [bacterium]|nr:GntR family transcriptional regulator [bacterium]